MSEVVNKDPAFPLYTQDFLVGITFMTNDDVGVYIRLLCYQHQHGGLIDKEDFISMADGRKKVVKKFIETDDGFYNERLMNEMVKRQKKSRNLSANALKRWKGNAKAMQKHIPSETETATENVNENINNIKVFKKPSLSEVVEYCKERKNNINPHEFVNYYESLDWKIKNKPMKSWKACVRTWEQRQNKMGGFIKGVAGKMK